MTGVAVAPAGVAPLLELRGVSRFFGGVRALEEVSMQVHAGAIHGLIGPNGAGKTTLLNLLTGFDRPTAGQNVLVARHPGGLCRSLGRLAFLPAAQRAEQRERTIALGLLARVGVDGAHGRPAGTLSYADQRRVELARALATEPRLLLLDEPSA